MSHPAVRSSVRLAAAVAALIAVPAVAGSLRTTPPTQTTKAHRGATAASAGPAAAACVAARFGVATDVLGSTRTGGRASVYLATTRPAPFAAEVVLAFRAGRWHCAQVVLP